MTQMGFDLNFGAIEDVGPHAGDVVLEQYLARWEVEVPNGSGEVAVPKEVYRGLNVRAFVMALVLGMLTELKTMPGDEAVVKQTPYHVLWGGQSDFVLAFVKLPRSIIWF